MLGSPRVLTNSLGEVVSRRDFLPFGEEIYADGTNRTTTGKYSQTGQDAVKKRFTGYEKDPETGLDFAEARMYENRFGRFTAIDPLLASGKSGNPQTFNRFVYCLNNPLISNDPTGLQVATPKTPGGHWWSIPGQEVVFAVNKPHNDAELITTRDHWGFLTYTPNDARFWNGNRDEPDTQIILNEEGPMRSVPLTDSLTGNTRPSTLSDLQRKGWERVPGKGAYHWEPQGVEDASLETALTVIPAAEGVGSVCRAGFSLIGRAATRSAVADSGEVVFNNGWRTLDGKFASPMGPGRAGGAAEESVWNAIEQKPGWSVTRGRAYFSNAEGEVRVYDGVAKSPQGFNIGLEVKSGSSRYGGFQARFDAGVSRSNPAIGVGKYQDLLVSRTCFIRRP